MGIVGAALLAACGGTGSSSSSGPIASPPNLSGQTLTIGDLAPFTGPDAQLGPIFLAGCYAATREINAAGGPFGAKFDCKSFDTRGDPADAVPATRQMLASTPNLVAVVGATSDEAATVVPILNASKMVVFAVTGQSEFDKNTFPYFYRLNPSDAAEAQALIAYAHFEQHATRVALAFGNDIGSQTFVQPAIDAIKRAGMTLASNVTLDLNATSFRTEAATIIQSKPDVIISEAFGPAAASFLSELKQENGKMLPVNLTSVDPTLYQGIAGAIGAADVSQYLIGASPKTYNSGPAYELFKTQLLASASQLTGIDKFLHFHGTPRMYDGIILSALAMLMANSQKPGDYLPFIKKIANGASGATVVTSYTDGVAALKAGKTIQYLGASGPIDFNQYNNSSAPYEVDHFDATGNLQIIQTIPPEQVAKVAGT
ncbi:MAG: ABC transporter substrate-binding protein [Candidatus Dormibacter sp.]